MVDAIKHVHPLSILKVRFKLDNCNKLQNLVRLTRPRSCNEKALRKKKKQTKMIYINGRKGGGSRIKQHFEASVFRGGGEEASEAAAKTRTESPDSSF